MATTPNYGLVKPDIAGSNGAWGGMLNADLDVIDSTLKGIADTASAAVTSAAEAQATATTANNLATTNAASLAAKILTSSVPPTAGDVYPDGTLWCVV